MDCKDVNELIAAYLDNEVTTDERDQIQDHLSTCQRCRQEIEALSATRNNLRRALRVAANEVTPSPQAWMRIKQRIEVEELSGVSIRGLVKHKLKETKDILTGFWDSRQPVWKVGLIGAPLLALAIALSLIIPSTPIEFSEASAEEIVINSSHVKRALGAEGISQVRVMAAKDGMDSKTMIIPVLVQGTSSTWVVAEVDVASGEVTIVREVKLTQEDKDKAFSIAMADPGVQELISEGNIIAEISEMISYAKSIDPLTEEEVESLDIFAAVKIGKPAGMVNQNMQQLIDEEGHTFFDMRGWTVYLAKVDLDEHAVVKLVLLSDYHIERPLPGEVFIDRFEYIMGKRSSSYYGVMTIHVDD